MMLIVGICFIAFLVIYAIAGSAVIYHLNAFSLPEWKGRRLMIIVFIVLSVILVIFAAVNFFIVPWESYANFAI